MNVPFLPRWLLLFCVVGVSLAHPGAASAVSPGNVVGSIMPSQYAVTFDGVMNGWSYGSLRIELTLYADGQVVYKNDLPCTGTFCTYPSTTLGCTPGVAYELVTDGFGPGAAGSGVRDQKGPVYCTGATPVPAPVPVPVPTPVPRLSPAYQTRGMENGCVAAVSVVVGQASSARTVRVDWGDGSTQDLSVPAGSANVTFNLTHEYYTEAYVWLWWDPGNAHLEQVYRAVTATVVGDTARGGATVRHDEVYW